MDVARNDMKIIRYWLFVSNKQLSTLVVNMALRPTMTGPILAVMTVAAVFEAVTLSLNDPPIDVPAPVYLLTLSLGVAACVAHLLAWGLAYVLNQVRGVEDRVEKRLDSHELLDLEKELIYLRAHPTAQRRPGTNIIDLLP